MGTVLFYVHYRHVRIECTRVPTPQRLTPPIGGQHSEAGEDEGDRAQLAGGLQGHAGDAPDQLALALTQEVLARETVAADALRQAGEVGFPADSLDEGCVAVRAPENVAVLAEAQRENSSRVSPGRPNRLRSAERISPTR